jgi:cytochrome c peroxidase
MGGMLPLRAQGVLDTLQLPLGLSARFAFIPSENPLTAAKVALGQQLFWDRRWSRTGTVACVDCHRPDHGWSDPRQFSLDHAGRPTARHTSTLINRLFSEVQGGRGTACPSKRCSTSSPSPAQKPWSRT